MPAMVLAAGRSVVGPRQAIARTTRDTRAGARTPGRVRPIATGGGRGRRGRRLPWRHVGAALVREPGARRRDRGGHRGDRPVRDDDGRAEPAGRAGPRCPGRRTPRRGRGRAARPPPSPGRRAAGHPRGDLHLRGARLPGRPDLGRADRRLLHRAHHRPPHDRLPRRALRPLEHVVDAGDPGRRHPRWARASPSRRGCSTLVAVARSCASAAPTWSRRGSARTSSSARGEEEERRRRATSGCASRASCTTWSRTTSR